MADVHNADASQLHVVADKLRRRADKAALAQLNAVLVVRLADVEAGFEVAVNVLDKDAAALGLGPADLIADLNTMGLLFETMCVRDLRVFADAIDGQVYHYRDKNGLECDAVIHLRNGNYGLVEIKLGGDKLIEEGASTLLSLSSKIDTVRMKSPSFLMVLTATSRFAYRREDGVYIVPIGCLRE